jgi:hypothetical protein
VAKADIERDLPFASPKRKGKTTGVVLLQALECQGVASYWLGFVSSLPPATVEPVSTFLPVESLPFLALPSLPLVCDLRLEPPPNAFS